MQSSEPAIFKLFFEGSILIFFVAHLKQIKITKNDFKLIVPIIFYLLWSTISAFQNNLSILTGVKYARYLIYSVFLYFGIRSMPIDKNRINKIVQIFFYFGIFQIGFSFFNLIFFGANESRIGTLFLVSGELGTIFPLTYLALMLTYYNLISKKKNTFGIGLAFTNYWFKC